MRLLLYCQPIVFIVLLIKVLVGRVVLVISLIEFLIVLANYYIVSILAV